VELSDIVVFGRYVEEERSLSLRWRGSSNQTVRFNNAKYEQRFNVLDDENEVEVHIKEDGEVLLLGYPDDEIREVVMR